MTKKQRKTIYFGPDLRLFHFSGISIIAVVCDGYTALLVFSLHSRVSVIVLVRFMANKISSLS